MLSVTLSLGTPGTFVASRKVIDLAATEREWNHFMEGLGVLSTVKAFVG